MAEKEKPESKPNGGGPPGPAPFDDSEFFTAEGITDDDEKEAIRSRARVSRYAEWRRAKETDAADPKKKKRKPWYQE